MDKGLTVYVTLEFIYKITLKGIDIQHNNGRLVFQISPSVEELARQRKINPEILAQSTLDAFGNMVSSVVGSSKECFDIQITAQGKEVTIVFEECAWNEIKLENIWERYQNLPDAT